MNDLPPLVKKVVAKTTILHTLFKRQVQESLYVMKGLVTRNAQVKYEIPTSSHIGTMANVNVFEKKAKRQGQGH